MYCPRDLSRHITHWPTSEVRRARNPQMSSRRAGWFRKFSWNYLPGISLSVGSINPRVPLGPSIIAARDTLLRRSHIHAVVFAADAWPISRSLPPFRQYIHSPSVHCCISRSENTTGVTTKTYLIVFNSIKRPPWRPQNWRTNENWTNDSKRNAQWRSDACHKRTATYELISFNMRQRRVCA